MATGDLVTWETVKAALDLDDDQQAQVESLISAASQYAQNIAGRFLAAQDVELYLDGNGARELRLPSYPVNLIVSLRVDVTHEFASTTTIEPETYSERNGIIRLYRGVFPLEYRSIFFEGNIGYNPVPADLQEAVIEIVAVLISRYKNSGAGIGGLKQISAPGAITTQYVDTNDIPLSARKTILGYADAPYIGNGVNG
jgi:hypothetical protein